MYYCSNIKCPNNLFLANGTKIVSSIANARYVCTECQTILCDRCFNNREHCEHIMFYTTKPTTTDSLRCGDKNLVAKNFGVYCKICSQLIKGPYCFQVTNATTKFFCDLGCLYFCKKSETAFAQWTDLPVDVGNEANNYFHCGKFSSITKSSILEEWIRDLEIMKLAVGPNILDLQAYSWIYKTIWTTPKISTLANIHNLDLTHSNYLDIGKGVCNGLISLHKFGLVHRNLTEFSVLIDYNCQAKISEFADCVCIRDVEIIDGKKYQMKLRNGDFIETNGRTQKNWQFNSKFWWDLDMQHLGFLLNFLFGGQNVATEERHWKILREGSLQTPYKLEMDNTYTNLEGLILKNNYPENPINTCFYQGIAPEYIYHMFLILIAETIHRKIYDFPD